MKFLIIFIICVIEVMNITLSSDPSIDKHFTKQFNDENVTYYSRSSLVRFVKKKLRKK